MPWRLAAPTNRGLRPRRAGLLRPVISASLIFTAGQALAEPVLVFETPVERLEFASDDIENAGPFFGEQGMVVFFELKEMAGERLADFTERAVGIEVTVLVCGDVAARAVVRDRLSGRGMLSAEGIEAADLLAEKLRGDTACGN